MAKLPWVVYDRINRCDILVRATFIRYLTLYIVSFSASALDCTHIPTLRKRITDWSCNFSHLTTRVLSVLPLKVQFSPQHLSLILMGCLSFICELPWGWCVQAPSPALVFTLLLNVKMCRWLCRGGYSFTHFQLLVGWFVGRIYTKTTKQISIKLWWRMGLSPEWTPLTSGADPDKRDGSRNFFLIFFNTVRFFSTLSLISQWIMNDSLKVAFSGSMRSTGCHSSFGLFYSSCFGCCCLDFHYCGWC